MLKHNRLILAIFSLIITSLACGFGAYDFDQSKFTEDEPALEQLAGTYLPTSETVTLIEQTGGYQLQNTSIHLSSDGTFEMQNMPDWWRNSFEAYSGIGDYGNGNWSLVRHQSWWRIQFAFDSDTVFYLGNAISGEYVTEKDLSGDKPPYSMWFYVGDSDKGRVMIFEQVMESP